MEKFVDFMSGKQGRALRFIVGAALVIITFEMDDGVWQWVLLALGALLIISAALKVCGFNLLVGRSINACPRKKK
ncbi:hypothetical protein CSA80_05030 [Candidatus Saccharibacteria bacterium]|nr:MAG: hypothetical protein CSA80_05030 [Candidatus Saccharibacteria bacterium]